MKTTIRDKRIVETERIITDCKIFSVSDVFGSELLVVYSLDVVLSTDSVPLFSTTVSSIDEEVPLEGASLSETLFSELFLLLSSLFSGGVGTSLPGELPVNAAASPSCVPAEISL